MKFIEVRKCENPYFIFIHMKTGHNAIMATITLPSEKSVGD